MLLLLLNRTPGGIDLQASLLNNTNNFYSSVVRDSQKITQTTSLSSSNTFYSPQIDILTSTTVTQVSSLINNNTYYNSIISVVSSSNLPSVGSSPIASTPLSGAFFKTNIAYTLTTKLFNNSNIIKSSVTDIATFGGNIYGASGFSGGFTNKYYSSISIVEVILGNLNPLLYTNTSTYYSPTVFTSYNLSAALYINTNTYYSPAVPITLTASLYTNTITYYSPSITGATSTLYTDLYTNNNNNFYSSTVTSIIQVYTETHYNYNVFYSISLPSAQTVYVEIYSNTNSSSIYVPAVLTGSTIVPDILDNNNNFYYPSLSFGEVYLNTDLYDSANILYTPIVNTTISIDIYDNISAIYTPTVSTDISLDTLYNDNLFYDYSLLVGAISVNTDLYVSDNIVYTPAVTTILYTILYYNPNIVYTLTVNTSTNISLSTLYNGSVFYEHSALVNTVLNASLYNNTNTFYYNIPSVGSSPIAATPLSGAFFKTNIAYNLTTELFDNSNTIKSSVTNIATFGGNIYGASGFSGGFTNKYYTSISIGYISNLTPNLYTNTNTYYISQIFDDVYLNIGLFDSSIVVYTPIVNTSISTNTNSTFNNILGSSGFSGGYNYVSDPIFVPPIGTVVVTKYNNANSFYTHNVLPEISISTSTYYNSSIIYPSLQPEYYAINNIPNVISGALFGGEIYNISTVQYYYYGSIKLSTDYLISLRKYIKPSVNNEYSIDYKNSLVIPDSRTYEYIVDRIDYSNIVSSTRNNISASFGRDNKYVSVNRDNVFIGKETIKLITYIDSFTAATRDNIFNSEVRTYGYFANHVLSTGISDARKYTFTVSITKYLGVFSSSRNHSMLPSSRTNKLMADSRTRVYLTGKREE